MSFNKKKFWMAFSIWHTKMIPIACITQWISGTHSFELVIAFNPKLILPPKIGNKWLSRLSHLFFKLYFRFFGLKSLPIKNISYVLQIFAIIWKCPKVRNYLSKTENSCIYFECHILCVIWKFYPLCDRSHRIHFCMTNARCHSKKFFFWMTYIMWYTTD